MAKMVNMPKIRQFKDVIRDVKHKATFVGMDEATGEPIYNPHAKIPTLKFKGSVKLHGTNAAIVYTWNPLAHEYEFHAQSKNNIITPMHDNMGFATFVYTNVDTDALLDSLMKSVGELDYTPQEVAIFGEWCGGSIQDKVALNQLGKMFVIFGVKIDDKWVDSNVSIEVKQPDNKVYNILDYPTYDADIDFDSPQLINNKLGEMTLEVEAECPVAKAFGVSGIGEGIVWKCVEDGYNSSNYWFKVKGDEHAKGSGKVKTLAPIDTERFENIKTLVEDLVTERRLEQGIEYFTEMQLTVDRKNVGTYIKWVMGDVVAEELTTIVENGFAVKDIAGEVAKKAKDYFFIKESELAGL